MSVSIIDELSSLIDMINNSPMRNGSVKNQLIQMIEDIMVQLPTVISEAEKITKRKEEILSSAQSLANQKLITAENNANNIVTQANEKAQAVLDNNNLKEQAKMRSEQMIMDAQQKANSIVNKANEYAQRLTEDTIAKTTKMMADSEVQRSRLESDTYNYVSSMLTNLEQTLHNVTIDVKNNQQALRLQSNRKK